jgi:hypothetical protein
MANQAPPPDHHQTTAPRSQKVISIGCQAETVGAGAGMRVAVSGAAAVRGASPGHTPRVAGLSVPGVSRRGVLAGTLPRPPLSSLAHSTQHNPLPAFAGLCCMRVRLN